MGVLLVIAILLAAGLSYVVAVDSASDATTDQLTINEASGEVSYVPNTINVGENGSASLSPTINWVTSDSVIVTTQVSADNSNWDSSAIGSTFQATVTGNVVTVTGDSSGSGNLYVKSEVTIHENITRTTEVKTITVNVSPALTVDGTGTTSCYFGEAAEYDLSNLITSGSNNYVFSMSATASNVSMCGFTSSGLYLLDGVISGRGVATAFAGDNPAYTLNVTISDKTTGETKTAVVSMSMYLYNVTGTVATVVSGTNVSSALANNSTYTADEGTPYTISIDMSDIDGASIVSAKMNDASISMDDANGVYTISGNANIEGTNVFAVTYAVGGYTYSFTFYLEVIANGAEFIIPDPDIVLTLKG